MPAHRGMGTLPMSVVPHAARPVRRSRKTAPADAPPRDLVSSALYTRLTHGYAGCETALRQPLRDLYGVGGGAFADLVAADEQIDAAAVVAAEVLADAADEDVVLAGRFQRHREVVGGGIVDDPHAGRLGEDRPYLVWGDRPLEFEVDALAVGAGDRHADARGRDGDPRVGEDLARLGDHLVLLLVVAVLRDLRVVAEEVVDDLVGELLL